MSTEGATGDSETRTFSTLQSFARALNHALRSPLAVISNDLHFLAAHDTTGVAATTATQVRRITALLDLAGVLGREDCVLTPVSLETLAQTLDAPAMESTGAGGATVAVDRQRFEVLLRLGCALVTPPGSSSRIVFIGEPNGVRCRIEGGGATGTDRRAQDLCELWPDRIEPPLLVALVAAHRGSFIHTDPHTIEVLFPREPR